MVYVQPSESLRLFLELFEHVRSLSELLPLRETRHVRLEVHNVLGVRWVRALRRTHRRNRGVAPRADRLAAERGACHIRLDQFV